MELKRKIWCCSRCKAPSWTIEIPYIWLTKLMVDRFMAEIERVLQSNEELTIDEYLIFEETLDDMLIWGAGKRCRFVNSETFLSENQCIIRIQNEDGLCCARAIVTVKAKLDTHEKWNRFRQGSELNLPRSSMNRLALLRNRRNKKVSTGFERLSDSFDLKGTFNGIIYNRPEAEKKIYLYYHNQHYDVITCMSAFLSKTTSIRNKWLV